jgi:hypothetical protein
VGISTIHYRICQAKQLRSQVNFKDFVDRALELVPHSPKFTKRTQGLLPVRKKYETNPRSAGWKRRSKIRNEPKTSQLATIRRAFDIWTIFVRAVAAGGIRGSDVMGNIGEIPAGGT